MSDKLFNEIKYFTVKQAGVEESEVTKDASLEDDLGIYGDDAVDFIVAFGKKFNVNVSKFNAADYFSPDGDFLLPAIIRLFTGKKKRKLKDLKIIHLEKAILNGRLDEDVINS